MHEDNVIVILSFCSDCKEWLATGDATFFDFHYHEPRATERMKAVQAGEETLLRRYKHLLGTREGEEDGELRRGQCDCCGDRWSLAQFWNVDAIPRQEVSDA